MFYFAHRVWFLWTWGKGGSGLYLGTRLRRLTKGVHYTVRHKTVFFYKTSINYPLVDIDEQVFRVLQVFQGSGIGKMEDNLTSADQLSYTTNRSGVDPGSLVGVSCMHNPTPIIWGPGSIGKEGRKSDTSVKTIYVWHRRPASPCFQNCAPV